MSDRAEEVALEFVPANATKIMVDTASGDRRVYSADEWREHIAAALHDFAEEARREERVVAAEHAAMRFEDGYECGVADERKASRMSAPAMAPPTDSLEAALRAALDVVDVVVCIRGQAEMCPCCRTRASAEGRASIPALSAAAREWMREQLSGHLVAHASVQAAEGWRDAMADVTRRLGLS